MCQMYIDVGSKNYKVRIDENPFCYVIMKRINLEKPKDNDSENWTSYKYPTTLSQTVTWLSRYVSLEKMEEQFSSGGDKEEATITLKEYLKILTEAENDIYILLGGK